jgi:hypothetical protein
MVMSPKSIRPGHEARIQWNFTGFEEDYQKPGVTLRSRIQVFRYKGSSKKAVDLAGLEELGRRIEVQYTTPITLVR